MKLKDIRPKLVETMPDQLELGVLYISKKYGTAIHLCCCGECGGRTVTPFGGPQDWTLIESYDGTVSLEPSIGNHQFPCRSHYFITQNRVRWC